MHPACQRRSLETEEHSCCSCSFVPTSLSAADESLSLLFRLRLLCCPLCLCLALSACRSLNSSRQLKGKRRTYSRRGDRMFSTRNRTENPLKASSASVDSPVGPPLPPLRLFRHEVRTRRRHRGLAKSSFPAMPRPKVKPQDRQRSVRACDACKASKKRCDANQPCRLCLKKGTQDACTYTPTSRDRRSRHSQSAPSQASSIAVAPAKSQADSRPIPSGPFQRQEAPFGTEPSALHDTHIELVDEDAESETDYLPDSRASLDRTAEQRPVMLYSSSGDKGILVVLPLLSWSDALNNTYSLPFGSCCDAPIRSNSSSRTGKLVFVGNTAALSFLRFLQKTLKHYVGPSGFTDRQHSHNWFEVTGLETESGTFYDDLGDDEKDEIIHCFLDAVSHMPAILAQRRYVPQLKKLAVKRIRRPVFPR